MNTQLQKLFDMYDLSSKDRHDFLQIYDLLPPYKQVKVVENFDNIISNIDRLRNDLYSEYEILFGSSLARMEEKLKKIQRDLLISESRQELHSLRKNTVEI